MSNTTCYIFLESGYAPRKESAKKFAHLQKLYTFYELDIANENVQKYLQNIQGPQKYSRNPKNYKKNSASYLYVAKSSA